MKWIIAAVAITIATPADASERAALADACMRRAMTQGLERYPPSRHDMSDEARKKLIAVMDANNAKKAAQARSCVTESEAVALGRLSLFIDTMAEDCRMRGTRFTENKVDPYWGDTDILNGTAFGYMGNNDKADGPIFRGQSTAREAIRGIRNPSPEICAAYWREFGPAGTMFPGMLQQTRAKH